MDLVKLAKAGQRGAGKAIARADALADAQMAASKAANVDPLAQAVAQESKAAATVKPKPEKASEVYDRYLGETGALTPPADRMIARPGRSREKGGPMFSWLSLVDPRYAEYVWANKGKGQSTRMTNLAANNPGLIFTPQVGSTDMHRSNQVTFERIMRSFKKAQDEGRLTPELQDLYNQRLRSFYKTDEKIDKKTKAIIKPSENFFPPDFDIAGISMREAENMPFTHRAAMAEVLGGKGAGGEKGQIIPYRNILNATTELGLEDVPTGSVGPRLFQLSGKRDIRPDLHAAFPEVLGGEDLGVQYGYAPRDIVAHDFIKRIEASKGRPIGPKDYELNPITFNFDRELVQRLEDAGYKEGGEVSLDAMRMAVDNKKTGGVAHLQAGGSKLNVLGKVGKAVGKAEAAVSARIEAAANLKKLHEDLLQQRGAGEARRLQRAADEIPNLETMYSDPALRRTFLVNRPSPLMTLNPSRFEDFAYPLGGPREAVNPQLSADQVKNIKYLNSVQGGFSDVPFLMVGKHPVAKYPSIDAHEGRHRSRVLSQQGREASLIEVPPTGYIADTIPKSRSQTSEGSIEAMRAALGEQRLVTPQGTPKIPGSRMELSDDDMRRLDQLSSASHSSLSPAELDTMFSLISKRDKMKEGAFAKVHDPDYAIELPELYKAGGAVRMADGDLVYRGKVGRERPESPGPSWGKVKDIGKELHSMLVEQTVEEAENAMQPGGVKNLLGRLGAATVGTPMDLVNLGLGGVDYLASADRVKAGKPDFLFKLAQEHPVGGAESLVNAMKSYGITNENETPLTDIAGQIVGGAGIAPARKGLNLLHNAATWRGTPVTATVEAVAPRGSSMSHLGQGQKKSFQDEITNRMILGDNAPVPMTTMGGLPTTRRPAQGVYLNNAGKLETNPMVAVDIPRMGSLSTNRPLRADIATAGAELGQESMAAHRFVPLLVNSPKDASAMLVKTPKGLTNEQVVALGEALPNVIVSHNPRLGGIVVMPFADDSGKLYALEHKGVKAIADRILGKDSQIKYGNADVTRDRLYLERPQYGEEGARLPSTQSTAERKRLLRGQKRVNSRG